MAATATAVLQQVEGTSWATAFPQVGGPAQNIDVLQIVDQGNNVLLNVDFAGVVHNPASGATQNNGVGNTRVGQFKTSLTSGTTAALFANAFTNPAQLDILQIISQGGAIAKYLDYLGVSH